MGMSAGFPLVLFCLTSLLVFCHSLALLLVSNFPSYSFFSLSSTFVKPTAGATMEIVSYLADVKLSKDSNLE